MNKAEDYKMYSENFEYEDGEVWDFIGYHNNVALNEIVAKGINFKKVCIDTDKRNGLSHILYSQVIEQDEKKTIMYDRMVTNYYTDDVNKFELTCENYITINHNKPLSQIKEDYKRENILFKELQSILQEKGYTEHKYKCDRCSYCCDCLNKSDRKYQEITMKIEFNDNQTIGEVKKISDNDYDEIKEFIKKFFKAEVSRTLCFTEQGAVSELEIQHYFK